MNNCKNFSSLDGMAYNYQCSDQLQLLAEHWQTNNNNNNNNNMKSQIENEKNKSISLWNY